MALTIFLADKSALELRHRHAQMYGNLLDLANRGELACCEVVALEVLYSARNGANYVDLAADLRTTRRLDVTHAVLARALEVQGLLAMIGKHRLPIPDLIIAATAELHGATVLHNDHDFEIIAETTGQPVANALTLWPQD